MAVFTPRDPLRTTRKVVCAIGTRPEAVKMAPLIRRLREAEWADCRVLLTGQHRDLVRPVLDFFGVAADLDLGLMLPGQSLPDLTARLLTGVSEAIAAESPDLVLAQGDTTTVLATALASHYARVPFGHVEAGLRTGRLDTPFPEEGNRVIAGHLSAIHFAPTLSARRNLLREGIDPDRVHVTGNTVIDALLDAVPRTSVEAVWPDRPEGSRLILVTAHRRDNFGEPLERVCQAIATLHDKHPDAAFLWPVHPNPAVRPVAEARLGSLSRVKLCDPMDYGDFVGALGAAYFVMTDSGGLQEEAPALGKPVLVLRAQSERPEAVEAGIAKLVGTDHDLIVRHASRLLLDPNSYQRMARGGSPYGDGHASDRIINAIAHFLQIKSPRRAAG